MDEIFKPIKNYENNYAISNLGNVKSFDRFRKNGSTGYIQKGKMLKQTDRGNGYLCVNLSKNGKTKICSIHRLVAQAFISNPENKKTVNHINGIKKDNTVTNLEWSTYQENMIHNFKILGFKPNTKGLKLGANASIKNNLNITNNIHIFNSYKEIIQYIKNIPKYKNVKDNYIRTHIKCCCDGKQKTAYGYKWKYNN